MSKLGDFLEAVYGPAERFTTVRASLRQWCHRDLAANARGGDRTVIGRRKVKPDTGSQIEEADLSVWVAPPGRLRVEKERRKGGQVEPSLEVVNGDSWWSRDHEGHVETPGQGRHRTPG